MRATTSKIVALPPGGCRSVCAFTLMEVLVASVMLGAAVVAATASLEQSIRAKSVLADESTTSLALAQEIYALALSLPAGSGRGARATTGAAVITAVDLDRAVFSPPIDATRASWTALPGWSQEVALRQVDLLNPDLSAGRQQPDSSLVEMTVTVLDRGVVRGAFTWWLNP